MDLSKVSRETIKVLEGVEKTFLAKVGQLAQAEAATLAQKSYQSAFEAAMKDRQAAGTDQVGRTEQETLEISTLRATAILHTYCPAVIGHHIPTLRRTLRLAAQPATPPTAKELQKIAAEGLKPFIAQAKSLEKQALAQKKGFNLEDTLAKQWANITQAISWIEKNIDLSDREQVRNARRFLDGHRARIAELIRTVDDPSFTSPKGLDQILNGKKRIADRISQVQRELARREHELLAIQNQFRSATVNLNFEVKKELSGAFKSYAPTLHRLSILILVHRDKQKALAKAKA